MWNLWNKEGIVTFFKYGYGESKELSEIDMYRPKSVLRSVTDVKSAS